MSGSDDLLEKIQRAKQEYYSENQKSILFKNKQKLDCASQIVQQIDPILVSSQVISFEENRIYFNYPLFKLVANPSLYMELTSRAFFVTAEILKSYSNYDIYINDSILNFLINQATLSKKCIYIRNKTKEYE